MNMRRGLLRAWMVISGLWFIGFTIAVFPTVTQEWKLATASEADVRVMPEANPFNCYNEYSGSAADDCANNIVAYTRRAAWLHLAYYTFGAAGFPVIALSVGYLAGWIVLGFRST